METHRTKAFGCWCMYSSTFFDWTGAYEIGSNTKVESGLIREGAFEYFVWILFQRWKHWREIRIVLIPTSIYSNSETPPKSATDVSVALRCIFSHIHRNDPDPTFSQSSFLYQTKTAKKALYLKLTSRLVAVDENEGKAHDYKVLEHQASFLLSGWDRCVVSAVKRFVGCFLFTNWRSKPSSTNKLLFSCLIHLRKLVLIFCEPLGRMETLGSLFTNDFPCRLRLQVVVGKQFVWWWWFLKLLLLRLRPSISRWNCPFCSRRVG